MLSADKGKASVIMDKFEYSEKLLRVAGDSSYSKVKKDSTPITEMKLSQILKKKKGLLCNE